MDAPSVEPSGLVLYAAPQQLAPTVLMPATVSWSVSVGAW
jgi:hypothetical protein